MPSPVAHSVLGLAVGVAASGGTLDGLRRLGWWRLLGGAALFGFLGNAPDIDFVPGLLLAGDLNAYHHVYTHSVGWCVLLATGVWCVARAFDRRAGWRLFLVFLAAPLLHLLADWVTVDRTPPRGILIAWPFSSAYSHGPIDLFSPMEKDTVWAIFSPNNLGPALRELMLTLPVLLAVLAWGWVRTRRMRG